MTEHWRRHPVGVSQQGALLREACWTLCGVGGVEPPQDDNHPLSSRWHSRPLFVANYSGLSCCLVSLYHDSHPAFPAMRPLSLIVRLSCVKTCGAGGNRTRVPCRPAHIRILTSVPVSPNPLCARQVRADGEAGFGGVILRRADLHVSLDPPLARLVEVPSDGRVL